MTTLKEHSLRGNVRRDRLHGMSFDDGRLARLAVIVGVVAIAVALGIAIGTSPLTVVAALVAAVGVLALARWNYGVVAGILLLLTLDGVPFVNTKPVATTGTNILDDLSFFGLTLLLAVVAVINIYSSKGTRGKYYRRAYIWAAAFFFWWALTTAITVLYKGIPAIPAFAFGRQYLYYLMILPVALAAFRQRQPIVGFMLTVAAAATLYSMGLIVTTVSHAQLSWLVHITKTRDETGLVRVYAPMNTLLITVFPMAIAAALLGPRKWRMPSLLIVVLTGIANALALSRAVYVSELVGIIAISLFWASRSGWQPRKVRRVLFYGAIAAVVAVAMAGRATSTDSLNPSSPLQAVADRFVLGFTNFESQTGTYGLRLERAKRSLQTLGSDWPIGLGFLEPKYHYVPGLRTGSIADSDLGSIMNILMTMGLFGVIFAYLPPVTGLTLMAKRRKGWLDYGCAMYLLVALIGSVTLDTVAGQSGVIILGCTLGIVWNWPEAAGLR
jgi:hypothetical protein